MQTFYATKQYARLKAIYDAKVVTNPADIQSAVASAILGYFATGNKSAAVAQLQALSTANPQYATQIKSFIDQLNAGTLKP
jgi:hypothetical protein